MYLIPLYIFFLGFIFAIIRVRWCGVIAIYPMLMSFLNIYLIKKEVVMSFFVSLFG